MINIEPSKSAAGAKAYYTQALSTQDYLSEGAEVTGQWFGQGARLVGLTREVDGETFGLLAENKHPTTMLTLTARMKADRRPGFNITFNATKGISLLYGMTGDERILQVFERAVDRTMRAMEKEIRARVRKGGADHDRVTGNIIGAGFTHFFSRPTELGDTVAPCPHLHRHIFLMNATFDPVEKEWKAVELGQVKADAGYFEAMFHYHLAKGMMELGYEVERRGKWWDIAGLSKELLDKFSLRTKEIEAEIKKRGITDTKLKAAMGAWTRRAKGQALSMDELRSIWRSMMNSNDHNALASVLERSREQSSMTGPNVHQALNYAISKCFEKSSVVDSRRLIEEAVRYGVGFIAPEVAEAAYKNAPGVLTLQEGERTLVTTRPVLAEESRMLDMARAGRGKCLPLNKRNFRSTKLNRGQEAAVRHVLNSWDRVMMIRGYAGTGKTTAIREMAAEIEKRAGIKVFACAPSADASRGTQRKEGFSEAETLEYLLVNEKLHNTLRHGLIWVDEASLIGCRNMVRLFDLAESLDARVLLTGDSGQHGSVERGDAFRLLEMRALESPVMKEIVRQKGEYKEACRLYREKGPVAGFDYLDKMGCVNEVPEEVRAQLVAEDYLWALNAGKSALVVTPTHAEGKRISDAIRALLKKDGQLEEEREVLKLVNMHWTDAEKSDVAMYEDGQVLQWVQNAPGFVKGQRFTVRRSNGRVWLQAKGVDYVLPIQHTAKFQVYRSETMAVAKGDVIRTTSGGKALVGKDIDNGCIARVTGFTGKGDICLDNGKVLSKDFGHIAPGYYLTSNSAQSRTVDRVLVSEAGNMEGGDVSFTRGREACRIWTSDKDALRERILQSGQRGSATELVEGRVAANTKPRDMTERARRMLWMLRQRKWEKQNDRISQPKWTEQRAQGIGR